MRLKTNRKLPRPKKLNAVLVMNYFHDVSRIFAALQTLITLTIYLKIGKKVIVF